MNRVDQLDQDGNTALHYACENGMMQEALYLISRMDCVENVNNKGETELMLSCTRDSMFEVSNILIFRTQHIDRLDKQGYNALMYACRYKSHQIALLLLAMTNNLEQKATNGETALSLAIASKMHIIVAEIINRKIKISTQISIP